MNGVEWVVSRCILIKVVKGGVHLVSVLTLRSFVNQIFFLTQNMFTLWFEYFPKHQSCNMDLGIFLKPKTCLPTGLSTYSELQKVLDVASEFCF